MEERLPYSARSSRVRDGWEVLRGEEVCLVDLTRKCAESAVKEMNREWVEGISRNEMRKLYPAIDPPTLKGVAVCGECLTAGERGPTDDVVQTCTRCLRAKICHMIEEKSVEAPEFSRAGWQSMRLEHFRAGMNDAWEFTRCPPTTEQEWDAHVWKTHGTSSVWWGRMIVYSEGSENVTHTSPAMDGKDALTDAMEWVEKNIARFVMYAARPTYDGS